jgi:amino acid permease
MGHDYNTAEDSLYQKELMEDDSLRSTENTFDIVNKKCWERFFGPIRGGSLRGATIAMASITFGGGCLSFPNAVAQTGPFIGLIMIIIVAYISYYTLTLLLEDGSKTKIMDFNGLIEKTMGKRMVLFSDIFNIFLCFGTIMSYQLTVYNFALQLGEEFFGIDKENKLNKLYLQLICTFAIQIPISMLKNISTLQYASIIGTIALIFSIFVIVCEMPFYLSNYLAVNPFPDLFIKPHWGYLETFTTFLYGFASHNGIFQIFVELKRPSNKRNHKILKRSFAIELVLYLLIGFCGYFSTLDATPGVFLDREDLPGFTPDYLIRAAKITLFICLHCSMAINFNIMRMSIIPMLFNSKEVSFIKDFVVVLIVFILSNVGVFFLNDVVMIIGAVGGFCVVVICFVIPIMNHIILSGLPHTHPRNLIRYAVLTVIVILGCVAGVKSIIDMVNPKEEEK